MEPVIPILEVNSHVMRRRNPASFVGLTSSSARASRAAQGASRKSDTACEMLLRRAVFKLGLRYAIASDELVGKPDLVFRSARVAVFCDGDFWHGRDLEARLQKLAAGHNAPYWVAKIQSNVARDRARTATLEAAGWKVLRYWEGDIKKRAEQIALEIASTVIYRREDRGVTARPIHPSTRLGAGCR